MFALQAQVEEINKLLRSLIKEKEKGKKGKQKEADPDPNDPDPAVPGPTDPDPAVPGGPELTNLDLIEIDPYIEEYGRVRDNLSTNLLLIV